jgi:hypothetical protein
MSDTVARAPHRLQLAAALLASSVLGAPLVIAAAVRAVLLGIDPEADHAAVIGVAAVVAFAGAIVAVALVFSRLAAQPDARETLRVPYMILLAQLVLGSIAIALYVLG